MYLIYDCLKNSPFSIATQQVLKHLNIPYTTLDANKSFKAHGGYFGRIGALEQFIFANVYNIALASLEEKKLLALEEDSYANLIFTLDLLRNNQSLRDFVVAELQSQSIILDIDILQNHIAYFPAILANYMTEIEQSIKYSFGKNGRNLPHISPNNTTKGFSSCAFYGSRHADCNMQGEYKHLEKLCKILGLTYLSKPFSLQSFTHLAHIDSEKAYQKSGDLLYEGIDLGVDFLCVFADSTFDMFDNKQDLCTKYCKRDPISIASLNMAQILLVCFGKADEAGFETHKINPDFMQHNKASKNAS